MKEVIEGIFITVENEEDNETFKLDLYDKKDFEFKLISKTQSLENFESLLDIPGDCFNKLFQSPEKFSGNQFSGSYEDHKIPDVSFKKVFKNSQVHDACYMYNFKPKNDYEISVLSARSKNEGWTWLMASKPNDNDSSFRDILYKELVLEKKDNKWIVILGHEGEIKSSSFKKAEKFEKFLTSPNWINSHLQQPCSVRACNNDNWKSLNLYWKPNSDSNKKLSQLSSNTEDQILRWDKEKEKQIYRNGNRKRIYWKGKWHTQLGEHKNKPLIKLKTKNITDLNGEWKSLYNICEDSKDNSELSKEKQTYCFKKKNFSGKANEKPRTGVEGAKTKTPTIISFKNDMRDVKVTKIQQNGKKNPSIRDKVEANPNGDREKKKTETQPPSPRDTGHSINSEQNGEQDSVKTQSSTVETVLKKQKPENESLGENDINEKGQKPNESSTPDTKNKSPEIINVTPTGNNKTNFLESEKPITKESREETILENEQGIQTLEELTASETSDLTEEVYDNKIEQPSKKENPFNYKLDFQENDFYKSFNNPGDCITRLFKGIKEDSIFKEQEVDNKSVLSVSAKDVFKGNGNDDKIDSACYTYHFKSTNETPQRLEIAVKGEKEGWVWMMGSKPRWEGSKKLRVWYREFILEKNNDVWKAIIGHEGEIPDSDAPDNKDIWELAKGFDSYMNHQWYDVKNSRECLDSTKNCNSLAEKSLNLYWKPDKTSKKEMVQLSINTGHQIIRWSEKKGWISKMSWDNQQKEVKHRKNIYHKGKWHSNINNWQGKPLINLDNNDVAKTKGSWENIYTLCNDPSQKAKEQKNYEIYCV